MSNQYSNFQTVRSGSPKKKSILPWALGCLGGLVFLTILAAVAYFVFFSGPSEPSSIIMIREPLDNTSIQFGEPVTVRAVAEGDDYINHMELWIDEQLINYQTSNVSGGISPFPIISTWYPTSPGVHTISARSTDSTGKQFVDQITVNIQEISDRDGDLIPDDIDHCPDQAGTEAAMGCIDRDYDGTPDDQDACPDTAGIGEDGCPATSENDRDGDGMVDEADACPDESGSPLADGCPDRDGDGFADAEDPCPDESGVVEGCPIPGDMDSDGVPDEDDVSPTIPRSPDFDGGFDSDGDGVLDHQDACPDTPGSAANNGCPDADGVIPSPPDPEDDDSDEGGSSGPSFGDMGFELNPPIPLEIRAHELTITGDYDFTWCYLQLGDHPVERYIFEPNGDNFWNIAEVLGGENSIHILHNDDIPLRLQLSCDGHPPTTIYTTDLIDVDLTHAPEDWNGRELYLATDSHDFIIKYQICRNSCDDAMLQTPLLSPITSGSIGEGPYRLHWYWGGRSANIDGFIVYQYRDGELYNMIPYGPTIRTIGIERYLSTCGHTDEFTVYAYKTIDETTIRSPISNKVSWTSDECMYTAEVFLNYMDVHNPQADEYGLHEMGPIFGSMAVGLEDDFMGEGYQSWIFHANWYSWLGTSLDGLWIGPGVTTFEEVADWIRREQSSCYGSLCHSNDYSVPDSQSLFIGLNEGQNFDLRGNIREADRGLNPPDNLFNGRIAIRFEDLILDEPVQYVLESDVMNVVVDVTLRRSP